MGQEQKPAGHALLVDLLEGKDVVRHDVPFRSYIIQLMKAMAEARVVMFTELFDREVLFSQLSKIRRPVKTTVEQPPLFYSCFYQDSSAACRNRLAKGAGFSTVLLDL